MSTNNKGASRVRARQVILELLEQRAPGKTIFPPIRLRAARERNA